MAEQFENRYDQLDQKKSFEQDHNVTEVDNKAQEIQDISEDDKKKLVNSVIAGLKELEGEQEKDFSKKGLEAAKREDEEIEKKLNPDL
jgi:hypothetical protein